MGNILTCGILGSHQNGAHHYLDPCLVHQSKQIDYVLAYYTQADVECELYMVIPKGFEPEDDDAQDYVLKLKKNLFGQGQAGRVWNQSK